MCSCSEVNHNEKKTGISLPKNHNLEVTGNLFLNKTQISTIEINKPYHEIILNENNYSYPNQFVIGTESNDKIIIFKNPIILHETATSIILEYIDDSKCHSIAVKIGEINDDIRTIELLNLNFQKIPVGIVPSYSYEDSCEKYVIMQIAAGNLSKLTHLMNNQTLERMIFTLEIIRQIVTTFILLFKKNLLYIDIKPENILYQFSSENQIEIRLGDLGSIIPSTKEKISTITYPSYDRLGIKYENPTEKDIVWGIGILIISLMGLDLQQFIWTEVEGEGEMKIPKIDNKDDPDPVQIQTLENFFKLKFNEYYKNNIFAKIDKPIVNLLLRTLAFNPSNRWDLKTSLEKIEKTLENYRLKLMTQ